MMVNSSSSSTLALSPFLTTGKWIERLLGILHRWVTRMTRNYKIAKYSKLGPGHVFDIVLDDMSLKMTFSNHEIGNAIVERIEGRREPVTTAIMRALVRHGNRVLELGGCYGEFTIVLSRCVGPEGRVITIEGTPNSYKVLQRNIDLNKLANVTAYNLFISNKAEGVVFGATENHPYQAIARLNQESKKPTAETVHVPTARLSEFLKQIQFTPDYIFMDIEGFEVEVFKDMSTGYFKIGRPVIVFEIHHQFYKGHEDLDFIKGILNQNHYYYRQVAGNLICFPQDN